MYYKEKDRPDGYFSESGRVSRRGSNLHRFSSYSSLTTPASRKIQEIKALVRCGLYETEDKIRSTAKRLLKFLSK